MKKHLYILLVLTFSLSGCRSTKLVGNVHTEHMRFQKLISQIEKNKFSASTLESRLHFHYDDGEQNLSASGKIRILKDSIIWGSINMIGIPMLKFMITPHRIQYYNKTNSTYYDGDFGIVSDKLGVALNFKNLQNLLLGAPIQNLDVDDYRLKIRKSYYLLTAKHVAPIGSIKINPSYKMLFVNLKQQDKSVQIHYPEYQKVGTQSIPKKIQITAGQSGHKSMQIDLEYKRPVMDKKLRFPFHIPSGYDRMR